MLKSEVEVKENFGLLLEKTKIVIRKVFTKVGRQTASYLREERFTGGTTDSKLAVRTGRLRASVSVIPIEESSGAIQSGVRFGTVYARVHVGPKDQVTKIVPKKAKYLAIPLPGAMTKAGVARGTPRGGPWGETFVRRVKGKDTLMIFGKMEITKGARAGQLRSKIIPLFILLKSVTIKARVHPEEILQYIEPKVKEEFRAQGINLSGV